MATRRESLAAVLGDPGPDPAGTGFPGSEANGSGTEEAAGFPFELLSGPGSGITVDEPVPTRVKTEKKTASKPADKTERARGTATERQLADLGEQLEEKFITFALLGQGLAPVTSVYAAENSPKAINALLSIAKRRPVVLKYLTKAADAVDVMELAKFIGGLVVCIQVDAQRLRGDEMPAQAFGVTQILEEFFWKDDDRPNPAVQFQAPRYAPV